MAPAPRHHGLLIALLVCGAADPVWAAVVNAQSGSRDDIQAAVNTAQAGDTVLIPAGAFVFSGQVTIDKALAVIGAGPTLTHLNSTNNSSTTYSSMFKVTASNVTIRDLSFVGMPQGSGAIRDSGVSLSNSQDFVVHNCHFKDFGIAGVSAGGADSKGVISNCRIVDVFRPEINNIGYGVQVVGGEEINWNRPLDLGSDRFVFVEDCYFSGTRHAIASSKGSRYVFRYNETHDPRPDNAQHIDAHGLEYGSQRGSRAFEIYGNVVDDTSGVASWAGITIRGGDGIIADNTFLPKVNNPLYLCNRMDGSSTCSYPNLDQTRELYVWNNTHGGVPISLTVNSSHACLFEPGRDYFYHAPPGYVPYPYPHPLVATVVPSDAGVIDAYAKDAGAQDAPPEDAPGPLHDAGGQDARGDAAPPRLDAPAVQDGPQTVDGALRGGCGCGFAGQPVGCGRGLLGLLLVLVAAGFGMSELRTRRRRN